MSGDDREGRRSVTIINKELNVKSDSDERTLDTYFVLKEINENLLLILKQLELITGEENYG